MQFLRVFLPVLVISLFLLAPQPAEAARANFFGPIISVDCKCEESAPDWGCVLDAIHNVFNLLFSLSVLVFAFTAAYAGILFMTTASNPEHKSRAKSMLLNTVLGILISLSAWLMVDFVMRVLYDDSAGWGPWNRILATDDPNKCLRDRGNTGQTGGDDRDGEVSEDGEFEVGDEVECMIADSDEYVPGTVQETTTNDAGDQILSVEFEDDTVDVPASDCRTPEGGEGPVEADGNWQSFFAFDNAEVTGDVRRQIGDESGPLDALLSCMAGNLPRGVGRISSISDKRIPSGDTWSFEGTRTFEQCGDRERTVSCGHTRNSCHYGGEGQCNGASYAVDFGDEENKVQLEEVARDCAAARDIPNIGFNDEGDHLHISVDRQRCDCDMGISD